MPAWSVRLIVSPDDPLLAGLDPERAEMLRLLRKLQLTEGLP